MNKTHQKPDSTFFKTAKTALRLAVAEVIEEHRRSGDPLVVSKDGKVVWLTPEQVNCNEK